MSFVYVLLGAFQFWAPMDKAAVNNLACLLVDLYTHFSCVCSEEWGCWVIEQMCV